MTAPPSPDPLADIERDIAALAPEGALMRAVEAAAAIGEEGGERGVRYLIARGIVENRNGFFETALATFHRARGMAASASATAHLARISREVARVHSWRGDGRAAALELLRSLVEAEEAGSRADTAAALAEVGRLNLEVGRYDAALGALERAASLAPGVLPAREPARIAVNRCEALLALDRHEDCLDLIAASLPAIGEEHRREHFLIRALRARALFALGRDDDGAAAAAEAEAFRATEPSSYEQSEWHLLEGLKLRRSDATAAIAALQKALGRFADDDLPRHEIETRIHLAGLLADNDRLGEAEACIAEALRRCAVRELPAMGDRARAAAVRFWRADRIADLSGENAIAPRPGEGGGRFLVIERLGAGGFGSVDRSIDNATGDEVAIKRMRADAIAGREDAAAEFATVQNEVKAAGKVSNRPYVARTRYLNIEPSGAIVLVQDFVRGPTLRTLLKDGADRSRLFSIGARLARAIAGIHARGIAHRDLKPENVIVRNGSEPVLIDLGLARFGGAPDVLSGMGTPPYAAPEQWEVEVDPRWSGREDIYALGIIIGELAGEAEPAEAPGGAFAAFRQRLARKSNLPAKLARLTQAMLVKDPATRTVDLHEVAAALDEAAAEEAQSRK